MADTIPTKQASSIGEMLGAVSAIRDAWGVATAPAEDLWFRGTKHRYYELLPALYRESAAAYGYDESSLFETFKALAMPFVRQRPASDWEWYFMAQHYGLPTRLLDWTESLFAALYFAVEPHVRDWDRPTFESRLREKQSPTFDKESPTVWMLDIGTLNLHSVKDDCAVVLGGEQSELYLPSAITSKEERNSLPVGIFPPRGTERIVAQQGMFTVHGHNRDAIDKTAQDTTKQIRLANVVLDRASIPRVWEELRLAGVTRLSLFPELANVAPHICWLYQSAQGGPSTPRVI